MKRSAAPSQRYAKSKFITPYARSKENDTLCVAVVTANNDNNNRQSDKLDTTEEEPTTATKIHNNNKHAVNSVVINSPLRPSSSQYIVTHDNQPERWLLNTTSNPNINNGKLATNATSASYDNDNTVHAHPPVHVSMPTKQLQKTVTSKFKAPISQSVKASMPSDPGSSSSLDQSSIEALNKKYFSVVWCKRSTKKHKKWEGDAVLIVSGRSVSLLDTDGKEIGKSSGYKLQELVELKEGETLAIGAKEIEVMNVIEESTSLSGKCFAGNQSSSSIPLTKTMTKVIPKSNKTGASLFLNKTNAVEVTARALKSRFDPLAPDALVLSQPPASVLPKDITAVDIVVDPHLSAHLRPHQRDGVNFLYECVMGYKGLSGYGAILADEMGLGKTLQIIALLWTLLKQNPISHKPVVRRALIVTPGSLVKNWVQEIKKWLGQERLKVFAVSSDKKAEEFKNAQVYPVMIVSYEMFVRYCDVIQKSQFDLLVCDEGHRLKNSSIKTTSSISTRRRIVVTGTPIQNDLKEFFALVDFTNPGILGNSSSFHKVYEDPILISKQPGCSEEERRVGEERAKELNRVTSSFILRRTSDVNQRYLPHKTEYVVFCRPKPAQINLYRKVLASGQLPSLLNYGGDGNQHLVWINELKKICNYPNLYGHADTKEYVSEERCKTLSVDVHLSGKLTVLDQMLCTLHQTFNTIQEKIILVSNYTQTLDILENLCKQKTYEYLRLDGQTPVQKRQQIVELFNSSYSKHTVFLLSSKAGGVGLNLIGANRLVLYDIDWNPANDLQAMARIWRDGQRRPVHIYRLLTTGTIEEKIYQRQVSKQALGNSVVDSVKESQVKFSPDDLKFIASETPVGLKRVEIIAINPTTSAALVVQSVSRCVTLLGCWADVSAKVLGPDTDCDTHDILLCSCLKNSTCRDHRNQGPTNKLNKICMSELSNWHHMKSDDICVNLKDKLLHSAVEHVSFMFTSDTGNVAVPSI